MHVRVHPEDPTLPHMEKSLALFAFMTKGETSWKRCWKMSAVVSIIMAYAPKLVTMTVQLNPQCIDC